MKRSLTALKTDKVDMWYLHAPDRSTPYEVTLKVVNEMYKEGENMQLSLSSSAIDLTGPKRQIQSIRNQQLHELGSRSDL
jgi:aryl-alcohol dehydrogenase-like predicted oxidoreductase